MKKKSYNQTKQQPVPGHIKHKLPETDKGKTLKEDRGGAVTHGGARGSQPTHLVDFSSATR